MKIVLVRHLAPDVRLGLCYGRLDVPLRPEAAEVVSHIAANISAYGVARVWTSPAWRCRALACAIAVAAVIPLQIDARLQELDFGAWEGLLWDAVPRMELNRWATAPLSFAPPGGEAGQVFLDRIRSIHQVIRKAGEDCAVVSHGGPLKVLAALLRNDTPDLLAPAPPIGSVTALTC